MCSALTVQTPQAVATEAFTDAGAAVGRLDELYEQNTQFLRDRFEAYANGELLGTRVRANYPFVRMTTSTHSRVDSRPASGFVARPGVYSTRTRCPWSDVCAFGCAVARRATSAPESSLMSHESSGHPARRGGCARGHL